MHPGPCFLILTHCSGTVSYTHLDVYKRQGPGVSGGSSSASQSTSGSAAVSTQAPGSSSTTESSSTGNGNVSLESPHASITPKEHNLVTSNVSLVAPGQSDGSSTDNRCV